MAKQIYILYVNYRGDKAWRRVRVISLYWGSNQWHPQPQWLLEAFDYEKGDGRTFAMRDVQDVQLEMPK